MEGLTSLADPVSFLHGVVDHMCGREVLLAKDHAAPAGVKIHDLTDLSVAFLQKAVCAGLDAGGVAASLAAGGATDAALHGLVAGVLAGRAAELRSALEAQSAEISNAHLTDFDWSLRLVLASDKLSHIRTPVLLLKLFLARPGGEAEPKREIVVELTKDELDALLADFKSVNAVLQKLALR